jgi:hypothetical protein
MTHYFSSAIVSLLLRMCPALAPVVDRLFESEVLTPSVSVRFTVPFFSPPPCANRETELQYRHRSYLPDQFATAQHADWNITVRRNPSSCRISRQATGLQDRQLEGGSCAGHVQFLCLDLRIRCMALSEICVVIRVSEKNFVMSAIFNYPISSTCCALVL